MKTPQKPKINHRFLRTRSDHQTERTEDYVEAILDEIDIDGRAQLTEIAKRLGVKHPTAAKALKKLSLKGFVTVEPYRGVTLTDEGLSLAHYSRDRHQVVFDFLLSIGLDEKTAELDAEGIEHHVSPKTIAAMRRFMKPSSCSKPLS